ncbi:hypothetical protein [Taibaiella soli]|uniref:Coproporphyrinogen III oxidase n=1 Tax=Taibaiella soli TaxID=1649169 RepID=A0A2W2BBZ4_9BACT|nr:hypothetical protein [Taibaiella soli]PZF71186.1 hypothetical protein DN068_19620 [Taibaiella soli]
MKNILVAAAILFGALLLGTSCSSSNQSDHMTTTDTVMNTPPAAGDTAMIPLADTMVPRSNINSDTPMQAQ